MMFVTVFLTYLSHIGLYKFTTDRAPHHVPLGFGKQYYEQLLLVDNN